MPGAAPQLVERALVIGAGGMLGRAWLEEFDRRAIPHDGVDLPRVDLRDPEAPDRALARGYSHVFNAAGWTDVDGAETREDEATELNARAVGRLADACARAGCHLTHISTDYVFAGDGDRPYPADAPAAPVNAYGRSKAGGEAALHASPGRWALVRTSWLYAPWGTNFVRTILRLMAERSEVRVVSDQRGRPTSVRTLARATVDLAAGGRTGVWHVTDAGEATWHELAAEIARRTGSPCRVSACRSAEFPRPARRPAYSVLDISETERAVGPLPDWRDALAGVLAEIARSEPRPATKGTEHP